MKRKYFGTNGVRGIIGDLMTPQFVVNMTSAIANFIGNKGTVVVGSDARVSSPFIKNAVLSSLIASGIEVIDVGTVPTPLTQFAVKHLKAKLGIMITASHNPPQFNGLKVIASDGIELSVNDQIAIEKIYAEHDYHIASWDKLYNVTKLTLIDEYLDSIISNVDQSLIEKKHLKVVVDGGNAVGSIVTPLLMKRLGIKVYSVNSHLDGTFPGRGSEPLPSMLSVMGETAKQTKADFAVAHDGDADRAIFGNEKGEVYWGDKSIALFEKWTLSKEKTKIFVTPVSSSKVVLDIANQLNGKVIWTPVGCIYVSRKMMESGSFIGGEENGGLFYRKHIPVRDGAMAAALMANIIAETSSPLSDLINELPNYYQKKDKIPCPNELKDKVLKYISENVGKAEEIITLDGVKLVYENSWSLIRPSGTEPIFRIFVEASSQERADQLLSEGKSLINLAIKNFS